MIKITEHTYCLGIWYVPGPGSDWLAAVTREGSGPLTLSFRFRVYKDDKHFDSDDEKIWSKGEFGKEVSEERIIEIVDGMVGVLQRGFAIEEPWRQIIKGDDKAVAAALKKAPFAQSRTHAIIHVLHHGYPLCQFSGKLPANWPIGHQWISLPAMRAVIAMGSTLAAPGVDTCEACDDCLTVIKLDSFLPDPITPTEGRTCEHCKCPIVPAWPAVYCSNECALADA